MTKLKSWADLAREYNFVLFNECIKIDDGAVLHEWLENHHCESQEAERHLDECDEDNCEICKQYKEDYGDNPYCECEPYQWYTLAVSDYEMNKLNEEYDLDIFYSDTLDLHIIPVYHYGTGWDIMGLKGGYVNL